jgi:cysteine desulfurase
MSERPIYLDYQATTPVDPRVLEAMWPYFREHFGNPHSVHHAYGQAAESAVEDARREVAALIGAEPREIVFTAGATESNNTAIKGAAHFHARFGKKHLITAASEHKCVLESCKRLEAEGFEVTWLPVRENGLVDPAALAAAIREDTVLVSLMAVNNEIGVIQPLAEIGALCRERGVYFHTDAAQAAGKIPLDVREMNIDLLSISGHKVYGPKGIGALYIRRRPRVRIESLIDGGGQERALRSGTVPVPLAVGLGAACRIAGAEMEAERARLSELQARLRTALARHIPDLRVNGDLEARIPGNLNVMIPGLDAETLIRHLTGVAVSTASACSSASVEPSYVLSALGLSDAEAAASLRIGLGRFTTAEEIDAAAAEIGAVATRLRAEGTSALATGAGAAP